MTIAKILVGLPSSMEIFKGSRWRAHLLASLPDLPVSRKSVGTYNRERKVWLVSGHKKGL